jgi:BirA family biotin operon repressor/biotin-[acetyl-CoA-carboxylase] ligase
MGNKEKIAEALEKEKGQWQSGEELSRKLGITRSAVSKTISVLRTRGYAIESLPGKGYKLLQSPDSLSAETLGVYLDSALFKKENFFFYESTDSTNIRARVLAENKAPEGTVVIAESQTHGKGRKGRSWVSSYGDTILASLILRPKIPPDKVSKITLLTAVAAAEAIIECTGLNINIKWPNDILFRGKKIAGILTEMSMEMDAVDYVVVGMGLNVNTTKASMPEAVAEIATSLAIEKGTPVPRAEIFSAFLMRFEHNYKDVGANGFCAVIERWKQLSDFIGKKVSVDIIGKTVEGVVDDINQEGILMIRDKTGIVHEIISGDVSFLSG